MDLSATLLAYTATATPVFIAKSKVTVNDF